MLRRLIASAAVLLLVPTAAFADSFRIEGDQNITGTTMLLPSASTPEPSPEVAVDVEIEEDGVDAAVTDG